MLAPSEPILAVLGKDAELPCHLSLNISAEDMELRWYRDQPSPAVHVHRAGRDVLDEQMARYQGRTTFLGARLAQGWAAVRIHNVTLADNGSFHCCFRDGAAFEEATLWLRVAGGPAGSPRPVLLQVPRTQGLSRASPLAPQVCPMCPARPVPREWVPGCPSFLISLLLPSAWEGRRDRDRQTERHTQRERQRQGDRESEKEK